MLYSNIRKSSIAFLIKKRKEEVPEISSWQRCDFSEVGITSGVYKATNVGFLRNPARPEVELR